MLRTNCIYNSEEILHIITQITDSCMTLIGYIDSLCPVHKTVDFQTSDAGAGVATNEEIVRMRLCEQFKIHNLDLQARFHYAPQDSKSHTVEQVHSALNDAVGDGRYIPLPEIDFLDEPDKLLSYTVEQFKEIELKKKKEITYNV